MKRKYLILTSFLMLLYMAPLLLAPSSVGVPILTEQTTGNEFLLANGPWLDGWDYRKSCTLYKVGDVASGYQVFLNVTYDSDMQNDFDDLRFTDNDMVTPLDFWIEEYTASVFALAWVEVTDIWEAGVNTDVIIYMYYGNNTVSTTSNGTATFQLYEDWSSQSIRAEVWDIIIATGGTTYSSTDANHGYVAKLEGDEGEVYHLESDVEFTGGAPNSIVFRAHLESTVASAQRVRIGSGTFTGSYALMASNYGTDEFMVADDTPTTDNQAMAGAYFDSFWRFEIQRDGTVAKLYANHTLIESGSCDPDVNTNNMVMLYVRDSEYDLYLDWVIGRKFVDPEPIVDSWGDEEAQYPPPPPTWVAVGTGQFIFSVGWDPTFQFGYDAFFIFLGLIMIPVSTMYLVRGGRDEMSSEKLFYGLIIFAVGFGLLVGGIMP